MNRCADDISFNNDVFGGSSNYACFREIYYRIVVDLCVRCILYEDAQVRVSNAIV